MIPALLLSRTGLIAAAIGLSIAFYEGVPGINRLPYLDSVPIVAQFGVGRVEIERRKAVAHERAAWEAHIAKLEATADALVAAKEAELAEIERAYLLDRAAQAVSIGHLQEIINELESNPPAAGACVRPSVSKRLSVGLDATGRSDPAGR